MRAQRSWLLRHFTFPSILAHYGTKPPLYWMWMRLFTSGSLGGYAGASFHCRVRFVDLVELTRLHTGHECCPEVPRTTARVLAENPRDGKTAVSGAARGKGSCLDLRYPNQRAAEERGSAGPMCGQEVAPTGEQEALSKWCEAIGVSFSRETKSAALKHDAKTRIEGGRVSPKACG
ncbi:hypothetical protein C3747_267g49 [Trypanosoma cruzi]|uniref:Uncharacterized protein n=1 Tax=Trypanosoma cruzi TaxID=5693 RepID=A0A2V2VIP3_TRYCR|nr:hypothetical protein C3747_267g49 [Trypanosoma cruzi]